MVFGVGGCFCVVRLAVHVPRGAVLVFVFGGRPIYLSLDMHINPRASPSIKLSTHHADDKGAADVDKAAGGGDGHEAHHGPDAGGGDGGLFFCVGWLVCTC